MVTPPAAAPTPYYLTIGQAAQLIGVHPRTIRRRIADGTLTGHRVGPRLIRLHPVEVGELLHRIPAAR